MVATLLCFSIWGEVWLEVNPMCSLPWWSRGRVVRVLPLCTQEHSRHSNKAIAVALLLCWLDKSLSAGLLPLKKTESCIPAGKWSDTLFPAAVFSQALVVRLSLLFFLSLPALLVPLPPIPTPLIFHTLLLTHCKQMEEKVSVSKIFPPPSQAAFHSAEPAWD